MKILGLFFVVFGGLALSRALGFSEQAQLVGAVMGAGSYLLIQNN